MFLAYILIGWIFSIYWGVLIVRKSWEDKNEVEQFLQATDLKSDAFGLGKGGKNGKEGRV